MTSTLVSIVKVDTTGNGESEYWDPGQVFAHPLDERCDFPVDTFVAE